MCILLVTLRTVQFVMGKAKTRLPFALRSPRWGNVLEASTWHCCPLGASGCRSLSESTLCIRSWADPTWYFSAYSPRDVMSTMHASPADAVRIFKDVKARKALAMHWGTWILTTEPVLEPPALLKNECEKAALGPDDLLVPVLGETVFF